MKARILYAFYLIHFYLSNFWKMLTLPEGQVLIPLRFKQFFIFKLPPSAKMKQALEARKLRKSSL